MASFTVKKIDDDVYERLRIRAQKHGVSMEEEVRRILGRAVSAPERLGDLFREYFGDDGVELEPASREPHEPMRADEWLLDTDIVSAAPAASREQESRDILPRLEQRAKESYLFWVEWAFYYDGLGDLERSFDYLEQAYDEHELGDIRIFRFTDDFYFDPRYRAFMERIGLPP